MREPKAYAVFAEVDTKGLTLLGVALAIKQTINDRDLIYASELAKIDVIITIIIEFSKKNLISKKMTKLGFLEQYLTKDQCGYYNEIFKTLSSDGNSLHIKVFILENQDLYREISNFMAINQIDNPRENKFTKAILEFNTKNNKSAGAAAFKDNVYSAEHLAYWYIVSIMLKDKIIYEKNKKTCLQHVFEYLPSLKKTNPNKFTDFATAIETAEVFQIKPEELKKSEYMTPFFAASTKELADAAMAELLSAEAKSATVKKVSTKAKKGSLKKKKIKGLEAASAAKTLKINDNYLSQISTDITTNKLPGKIKTIFCLAEVISKIITPDQQSFFQEICDSTENKFKNSSTALHYTTDLDMDRIIDFWNHSIKTMIQIVPPNNKKNSRILDYLASKIILKIEADLLDYINKNFSELEQVFLVKSTATRMMQANLGLPLDITNEYDLLFPEIKASLPKDPKFHPHMEKPPFSNDSHHEFVVDYRQRTLLEYEGLFKNLQKIYANIRDFRLVEVKHDQLAENFMQWQQPNIRLAKILLTLWQIRQI